MFWEGIWVCASAHHVWQSLYPAASELQAKLVRRQLQPHIDTGWFQMKVCQSSIDLPLGCGMLWFRPKHALVQICDCCHPSQWYLDSTLKFNGCYSNTKGLNESTIWTVFIDFACDPIDQCSKACLSPLLLLGSRRFQLWIVINIQW